MYVRRVPTDRGNLLLCLVRASRRNVVTPRNRARRFLQPPPCSDGSGAQNECARWLAASFVPVNAKIREN